MSGKRRFHERQARLAARAEQERRPAGAEGLPVNREALAPSNSYDEPGFVKRGFYVDTPFVCRSCGEPQVWTAAQQKWWYEVARGDVFSTASLCRPCRQRERARRREAQVSGGDPNPYKDAGLLLARVRTQIEPELLTAGYRLVGRNRKDARPMLFLDYAAPGAMLSISWDQRVARLSADLLTEGGAQVRSIASVPFGSLRSTPQIEARLADFLGSLRSFLEGPASPHGTPGPGR
ncbi:zinc-ribbon domain containing protein [Aquisphaera insulae]|uniref:zinc-ribbon domain containing protein n=1 Tax=Aquisphaera insulae TaxID=2712864 RepID=UPI0013EE2677|nr:zinc-ribbon domain containing protein [Aquisphaera insulae]